MGRPKKYTAKPEAEPFDDGDHADHGDLVVRLPWRSSAGMNNIDLGRWEGLGFDEWLRASAVAMRGMLRRGSSPATVASVSRAGLQSFIHFLAGGGLHAKPKRPQDVKSEDLNRYVAWLRNRYSNQRTGRTCYAHFASLLAALEEHGYIGERERGWMPANPFSSLEWTEETAEVLSPEEMKRLAAALKADLVAIHQGRFEGPDSEAIAVHFVVLALRAGINLTPMLEMGRDCLRPHPAMPNMMLIETVKRRGRGRQETAVRRSEMESSTVVPMDSVGVLRKVLEMTKDLSAKAPAGIKDRVWLYVPHKRNGEKIDGVVNCLSENNLAVSIDSIIGRNGLLNDVGAPLRVTVGILRKTKASMLWRLTDGDLAVVASAMGHTLKVADSHYLTLDERSKAEGAKFIGEAFADVLRGADLTPTPTGSCKDSMRGALAPKDGSTHCSDFMNCLSCPSYAIVGSAKDLHRLFSYQRFLKEEMDGFEPQEWNEWRAERQRQIAHIDEIADGNFSASIVAEARAMTARMPHKFWAIKLQRS